MKIRLQADADLRNAILSGVLRREPAIDFQSAHVAQLEGLDDQVVLLGAAEEGRILVSHDFSSMPSEFTVFLETHESPGVFLISQRLSVRDSIEWLILIWAVSEARSWQNQITYLPL